MSLVGRNEQQKHVMASGKWQRWMFQVLAMII